MPREVEYWRRRNLGQCVECDQLCGTARCGACQERRKLWGDRSGDKTLRDPGIGRRLAGHREARERRDARLRTGSPIGPEPSKEVRRKMEREQSVLRRTAPAPRDGKLPVGIDLDGIAVEWWTLGGAPWAWPAAWGTADVRLASEPGGWRLGEIRWITLSWQDHEQRTVEQEVEVQIKMISCTDVRLSIKSVPSGMGAH